jgi:putative hydrolase
MKYLVDVHNHTIASGHAYSSSQENVKYASEIGMKLIAVTDHGPAMPGGPGFLYFPGLRVVPRTIYGVEILRGIEANIIDYEGKLDLSDEHLKNLDVVIVSFHDVCIKASSKEENTRAMLSAMDNEYVDIIGHPGNPQYEIDIVQFVRKAKEKSILIEINNGSFKKSRKGSEENCLKIALEAKKQGVGLILGSDAHICYDIGNLVKAQELVEKAEIPEELIMNTSPEKFKKYLFDKGKALDLK